MNPASPPMVVAADGPFMWWSGHMEVMVPCFAIAILASGIVIFTKQARASSVFSALLSSALFTALIVPYLSMEYGFRWTSLFAVSALIGFGSMTLSYTAIRVSEILQRRAESVAGKWGSDKGLPPLEDSDRLDRDRDDPRHVERKTDANDDRV